MTVASTEAARRLTHRRRASVLDPEVSAALAELSLSDLVVTLDLAVRRGPSGPARLHGLHGVRGDRVTAVSTAFTGVVELTRHDLARWQDELARAVTVSSPGAAPPPRPGLLIPWDLLVGTAAARARHRPEVYDVLVARALGACHAGNRELDLAGCHEQLRRLHGSPGRLRVVGAGSSGTRRRIGWVSWLLFADGWHALTPTVRDHRPMVRLEPRDPADLASEAAVWLAEVRR